MTPKERKELARLNRKWALGRKMTRKEICRALDLQRARDWEFKQRKEQETAP